MARRSVPPSSGTTYIPHTSQRRAALASSVDDEDRSAVSQFIEKEILAPEKLPGNLNMLTGLTMFIGGIIGVRIWGELMVPT